MAGRPVAVVIAAGPGVSGSLARRFAREGYDLALVGRETEVLHALAGELEARGATVRYAVADVTDAPALTAAVTGMADELGRVDWLHFNPSAFRQKTPVDLTAEELLTDVGLGVGALLTALHAVRPYLRAGARVTATGSMAADKPWNEAASLGVQKAGLRNLIKSIDTTLEPDGVRAVSLTVRGTLGTDGPFTPDRVADAIWDAGHQDESDWQTEVPVHRLTSGRHTFWSPGRPIRMTSGALPTGDLGGEGVQRLLERGERVQLRRARRGPRRDRRRRRRTRGGCPRRAPSPARPRGAPGGAARPRAG